MPFDFKFDCDAGDLRKIGGLGSELEKLTKVNISKALNDIALQVARNAAENISGQTGMDAEEAFYLIKIDEATPNNLVVNIDATAVAPVDWQRPWEVREEKSFEPEKLVRIVTLGDKFDCEICEQAAENSPYTMDDIAKMQAKWANFTPATGPAPGERTNLIHPNCRCCIQPWQARNSAGEFTKVNMTQTSSRQVAPKELFTISGVGQKVADELQVSLTAAIKKVV